MLDRIRYFIKTVNWRKFSLSAGKCPLCGPSIFVRLFDGHFGVRCLRCGAAQNTFALVHTIRENLLSRQTPDVHVISAGGPYFNWLEKQPYTLWRSQYFDDTEPGTTVDGIRCEDLQNLTYKSQSFNLVTNSEVLEHVPNDKKAFQEIYRVLKPGGKFIFTVPLNLKSPKTVERAFLKSDGTIEHVLEPQFHDDPMRGKILAFRTYGQDLTSKLKEAGFAQAQILMPPDPSGLGRSCPVVMAVKSDPS